MTEETLLVEELSETTNPEQRDELEDDLEEVSDDVADENRA